MTRKIVGDGVGVTDGAGSLGQRLHRIQHAAHVGVFIYRNHIAGFHARRAALLAVLRIGESALERALGDADPLHADIKPRSVHHHEHVS